MKRIKITIVLLIAVSLLSIVVTLCMGAVQIPVDDTLSVLLNHLFGIQTGAEISVSFVFLLSLAHRSAIFYSFILRLILKSHLD